MLTDHELRHAVGRCYSAADGKTHGANVAAILLLGSEIVTVLERIAVALGDLEAISREMERLD